MIDEYVKIGMTAKMYLSVSVKGENDADRQPCICVGKIEKILSEHEVEIEVLHQSEESFSKKYLSFSVMFAVSIIFAAEA